MEFNLFLFVAIIITINSLAVDCFMATSHHHRRHRMNESSKPGMEQFTAVIYVGSCDNLCSGIFVTPNMILSHSKCIETSDPSKVRVYANVMNYLPDCKWANNPNPVIKLLRPDASALIVPVLLILSHEVKTDTIGFVSKSHPISDLSELMVYNLGSIKSQKFRLKADDDACAQDSTPEMICGQVKAEGNCSQHSGLPLVLQEKSGPKLVGLLTEPTSCKNEQISRFLDIRSDSVIDFVERKTISIQGLAPHPMPDHNTSEPGIQPAMRSHLNPNPPSRNPENVVLPLEPNDTIAKKLREMDITIIQGETNTVGNGNCICGVKSRTLAVSLDPATINAFESEMDKMIEENTQGRQINIQIQNENNNNSKNTGKDKGNRR